MATSLEVLTGGAQAPEALGSPSGVEGSYEHHDYEITSSEGGIVRAYRTSDPPVPKQGYGGHPVGARPKRKALTVYQGRQPFTIEVPMLLWNKGKSVERNRMALENMATTEGESERQQPPTVNLLSFGWPLPIPPRLGLPAAIKWWLEDIVWGEEWRRPPELGGELYYKLVTVTFLEVTVEETLDKAPKRKGKYRVKKGDTLKSIAARYHTSVATIKKLNPGLRSDGSLKVNEEISVPSASKPRPPGGGPKAPGGHHKAAGHVGRR